MSERQEFDSQLHSEVLKPQPIFRVYEGFGAFNPVDLITGHDVQFDSDRLKLFIDNGFTVIQGGTPNMANPLELCISGYEKKEDSIKDQKEIASISGIPNPRLYNPLEMINSNEAVIAKMPEAQRGLYKYLLDSREKKIRFVALSLLFQEISPYMISMSDAERRKKVADMFKITESLSFSETHNTGLLHSFVFEEFVETPGNYFNSFRIVSDAFGNIHYGQVLRSDNRKGEQDLPLGNRNITPPDFMWGELITDALEKPGNPFFIGSNKVVSNKSMGGKPLLLNGNPVADPIDRQVLIGLEIDPDNPQIPNALIEPSRRIGKYFRKVYPVAGIDFLRRKNSQDYVLLEVNATPGIRPEAFGLQPDAEEEAQFEILKRVINTAKQEYFFAF